MQTLKNIKRYASFSLLAAASCAAQATDLSVSGYGTIGYAKSDSPVGYQRDINSAGSFKRDTMFGAQLNAQFTPEWSAVAQAKLARAPSVDRTWQTSLSWAFLSYRPTDDLLLRAGKLRIPFYMDSENADVGATFAPARLPIEVYSTASTVDFDGVSFAKTWAMDEKELNLDGYWGQANSAWRFYARDFDPTKNLTPTGTPGEFFVPLATESKGLRLSLRQGENTYQAGLHLANTHSRKTNLGPSTYILGPSLLGSGIAGSYYTLAPDTVLQIDTTTTNVGMSIDLGHGFRTIDEYVRRKNTGSALSPDSESFYLMLQKEYGKWTPYINYAQIQTKNRALYQAVNSSQVQALVPIPAVVAGAAQLNASQRIMTDAMVVYDQHSWALGTSYTLNRNSKLKAEWSVVQTGVASSFIDAPPGGETGNKRINVMSFSYNFTF